MKKGNKCPFNEKKCSESCSLFRKGFRYYESEGKEPVLVEICAFNLIADCLENMVTRTFGLQVEMNNMRESTNRVGNIFEEILEKAKNQKRLE